MARLKRLSKNMNAFLDLIGYSEGSVQIPNSNDGYQVLVGSTPNHPLLFHSYSDHPRQLIKISESLSSSAAGRYQTLSRIFDAYKPLLLLPDFCPESQDKIALQLVYECRATADIEAGNISDAIHKCSSRWASFPGNDYGQHQNEISTLLAVYRTLGGTVKE